MTPSWSRQGHLCVHDKDDREPRRPDRGSGGQCSGLTLGAGLLLAMAIATSGPAVAATATGSMDISATVVATCVVSTTPMAFGDYTGLQAVSTATVSITCTNTTPYNVGLGVGLGAGATVTTRAMTGPAAAVLNYSLTSDAAHAVNWGTTVATDTIAGTGNGVAQPLTVYGLVAAGQFVAPGVFTDTVVATVTY